MQWVGSDMAIMKTPEYGREFDGWRTDDESSDMMIPRIDRISQTLRRWRRSWYFCADAMKQGLIKPPRNGIQASRMGNCHAIGPVPVASPWTLWGGCGGIGRRAALRSLWANNPWKFESSQPHHLLI